LRARTASADGDAFAVHRVFPCTSLLATGRPSSNEPSPTHDPQSDHQAPARTPFPADGFAHLAVPPALALPFPQQAETSMQLQRNCSSKTRSTALEAYAPFSALSRWLASASTAARNASASSQATCTSSISDRTGLLHGSKLSRKPIVIASEEALALFHVAPDFLRSSVRSSLISVPDELVTQAFGTRSETEEDEETFCCSNLSSLPCKSMFSSHH
jgi:hypothetical protein